MKIHLMLLIISSLTFSFLNGKIFPDLRPASETARHLSFDYDLSSFQHKISLVGERDGRPYPWNYDLEFEIRKGTAVYEQQVTVVKKFGRGQYQLGNYNTGDLHPYIFPASGALPFEALLHSRKITFPQLSIASSNANDVCEFYFKFENRPSTTVPWQLSKIQVQENPYSAPVRGLTSSTLKPQQTRIYIQSNDGGGDEDYDDLKVLVISKLTK